jgi:HEAT repeat protein
MLCAIACAATSGSGATGSEAPPAFDVAVSQLAGRDVDARLAFDRQQRDDAELVPAVRALTRIASGDAAAQPVFDQAIAQLTSRDADARRRAVQALKASALPEAAVPLAPLLLDSDHDVQLEAIAAELNIFLAEKATPARRVGFLIEVRGRLAAEPIFSAGPSVSGPLRVPSGVARALASASQGENAGVAIEALYAFGTLAGEVSLADRPAILAYAAPLVGRLVGDLDPAMRQAALEVIGRVYAPRAGEPPVDGAIGDSVVAALNDREDDVRETAMWTLGSIRYARAVRALTDLFHFYRRDALADASLAALARIGARTSLDEFDEQLASGNETFRRLAIEGLARTGDRSRLSPVLSSLTDEDDNRLLLAGHFANVMLAGGDPAAILDALARPALHDQARSYLIEAVAGRADLFGPHLNGPDGQVRIDLVDAFGLSGDRNAIPFLRQLARPGDPRAAAAVARALARLGSPAS